CLFPADDRRLRHDSEKWEPVFRKDHAREDTLMTAIATIRIQEADFDIAHEIAALTKDRTDIGAVVSFSGICRGSENGEPIAALTLEHYPGIAEAEIQRHVDEAQSRWPLTGLTVV